MEVCSNFARAITRKKHIDEGTMNESKLRRILNTFDITALGVGSTLGAGVYVLTGAVAKNTSGPSVVIAFLIAALTSVLSGLCYAEFGARVPKAGSGYVYSYVTVGELCAFVIGWNLILSYVIGAASVARAWTANFDALLGNKIETFMLSCCSMNAPGLAAYPDIFSFVIIIILTALIAFGVKEFAVVNKIFTVLNICVIIFVVIAGLTHANLEYWNLTPDQIYNMTIEANNTVNVTYGEYGTGGFAPYGFAGLISGTATCFYAFVGFDCIATTGEEAKNPQKAIPLGIVFSLTICCFAYLLISSTLTLMQPYFLLDTDAPLPYAFEYVGLEWAKIPVSIGAICALSTSLLGSMFPMPRIIYAMAVDGLLFSFFATVSKKTKTPVIATFISGTLAGIMAVLFDLKELVDLMSIGTLAAYTLVASSVMLLRYQPEKRPRLKHVSSMKPGGFDGEKAMMDTAPMTTDNGYTGHERKSSFNVVHLVIPRGSSPTEMSSTIVNWATVITGTSMVLFSIVAIIAGKNGWTTGSILFACIFGVVIIGASIVIILQPQNNEKLTFKVPLVPFIPIINMFVNLYLMVSLPVSTWYKMVIWMVVGFVIYFGYGIRHSVEGLNDDAGQNGDVRFMNNHDEGYAVVPTQDDEQPLEEKESEI
uniref:high affinity cationic amino acid transporter 1-like n=1 Tax=Styela clava TaxID=7725 RepID=UPI001939541B|nr:high affinity cationic amino acid transporter 1-like [Styela clava]